MLLKNPYCKNISQMSNKNICKLPQTSNFGSELLEEIFSYSSPMYTMMKLIAIIKKQTNKKKQMLN